MMKPAMTKSNTLLHRVGAFLMAGILILSMAGCKQSEDTSSTFFATDEDAETVATTGRWMEEKVVVEGTTSIVRYCSSPKRMEDGSILCFVQYAQEESENSEIQTIEITSNDNGKTWSSSQPNWISQVEGTVSDIFIHSDGTCFIITDSTDNPYWLKAAENDSAEPLSCFDDLKQINSVSFFDDTTVLISGSKEGVPDAHAPDAGMNADGTVFVSVCAIYDISTSQKIVDLSNISGVAEDGSNPEENVLYTVNYSEQGANLSTIKADGSIEQVFENMPTTSGSYVVADADQEGNYYYLSTEGIYRIAKGGSFAELVVDANSFRMGLSNYKPASICRCENGDYLILLSTDTETSLYRYYWDNSQPTSSTGSITVWSLEDNQTVRAAITEFTSQHPEIDIDYQIALSDSSISKEDSISNLNAQLLAASGPDILIMDGLDYTAYQAKGLLADYSDAVDTSVLLQNIVSPFIDEDGKITVLPARFSAPLIMGDDSSVSQISSLQDLQSAILACDPRPAMDFNDEAYYAKLIDNERYGMSFLSVEDLLDFVLQSSAPAIWDGTQLNTEAVQEALSFISGVGQYYDMQSYKQNPSPNLVMESSSGSDEVPYGDGLYEYCVTNDARYGREIMTTPALLGYIGRTDNANDTVVVSQPGLVNGPYLPSTLAALNTSSQHPEEAKMFLSILFSDAVQDLNQQDGCPVRVSSMEKSIERNQEVIAKSYSGNVMDLIQTFETPVFPLDDEIHDAMLNAANDVITGKSSIETATQNVINELSVYLTEKQR